MGVAATLVVAELSDVHDRLGIALDDVVGDKAEQRDRLLARYIAQVGKRIEEHLGRGKLAIGTGTENYNLGPRQARVFLIRYPVVSIEAVRISVDSEFSTTTPLPASEYRVKAGVGELILDVSNVPITPGYPGYLETDPMSIQVSYTAGLTTDTATLKEDFPDIYEAAQNWIVELYERRSQQTARVERVGEYGFTRVGELTMPGVVAEALAPHVSKRFPL